MAELSSSTAKFTKYAEFGTDPEKYARDRKVQNFPTHSDTVRGGSW